MANVLVVDNGSYHVKAGYVTQGPNKVRCFPNLVGRDQRTRQVYVADELHSHPSWSGLSIKSPFEKGYIINWDPELTIWDRLFSDPVLATDPAATSLIMTEPVLNLGNVQEAYDQILYEEFGFARLFRTPASTLAVHNPVQALWPSPGFTGSAVADQQSDGILVVDIGHSATHIIPMDVGGKLLTNYLKETVSFRQWNMMDETALMNHVKETCCFVSPDLGRDLHVCKSQPLNNSITLAYTLPDLTTTPHGYIKSIGGKLMPSSREPRVNQAQTLYMDNERFTVPELLFHPSDIGIGQKGLAEAIVESVTATPRGLKERLYSELRPLVDQDYLVRIGVPDNSTTYAVHGGFQWARHDATPKDPAIQPAQPSKLPSFADCFVTRQEYFEHGSHYCQRRFDSCS
ncbi:Actin- protein 6 [Dimargaris verticillata]|uniref:Actin-like protein ARP6 n=1 Tax=Dimargaris verticillata TaxID=2761393 RepID=A0A9W8E725_9FUNG|nr:Actin- protein 6 [Dimargaris verticillata]